MTLQELIALLEGAEQGSRELDAEIDRQLGIHVDIGPLSGPWSEYPKPAGYSATYEYTASVDAAISLAERLLPGWHYHVGGCPSDFLTDKDKPFSAELMGPVTWGVIDREVGEEPIYDTSHSSAHTAPLALVLATLRALQAKTGDRTE